MTVFELFLCTPEESWRKKYCFKSPWCWHCLLFCSFSMGLQWHGFIFRIPSSLWSPVVEQITSLAVIIARGWNSSFQHLSHPLKLQHSDLTPARMWFSSALIQIPGDWTQLTEHTEDDADDEEDDAFIWSNIITIWKNIFYFIILKHIIYMFF